MPEPLNLLVSIVLGAVGLGYFIYGKKQGRPIPLIVGLFLMVFPYFVSNVWVMLAIGAVLVCLPFLIRI